MLPCSAPDLPAPVFELPHTLLHTHTARILHTHIARTHTPHPYSSTRSHPRSRAGKYHFICECFFMAARALQLGLKKGEEEATAEEWGCWERAVHWWVS